MVQSKTSEKIEGLDEILVATSRAISDANLKTYQAISPLLEYIVSISRKGKRIPLTAPRKEALPNPKNGQIKEYDVWYEAKDGRIEKVAYDPYADMFDQGATFTVPLT